jgi:uncharacterized protein involved in type VI secretion and phage assembly
MNSHSLGHLDSLQLGRVLDNRDPENRGRVQLRLHALPMEVWAAVVAPSAGHGYGVCCVPRIDEIVVVAFVTPDFPLVLGSLWAGGDSVPSDADAHEDKYVIRTPAGTVLEFDDGGSPKLELRSPSGYRVTINEGDGGTVKIERGGESVSLTPSGIDVRSSGTVTIDASTVTVNAGMVQVNAGMSRFSGVVQADTVITNAVVSSSYTPGAGNIW